MLIGLVPSSAAPIDPRLPNPWFSFDAHVTLVYAASALGAGEVEALEGLCVGLLQGLASHRAADSHDPHDTQHCLPAR